MPPSANRYWRKWRGRIVKSKEAREFQEYVQKTAKDSHLVKPVEEPVAAIIDVWAYKNRNLDNCVKVLLDALNGVAFIDDIQVETLWVRRMKRPDREKPHVEVTITTSRALTETLWDLTRELMKSEGGIDNG